MGDKNNWASANPKIITTTYDSQYHLYPVQVTNPLNQTTSTAYDLALSVPLTVTDANGASTNYHYDTFGRLTEIYKPYDAAGDPSTRYTYYDTGSYTYTSPFLIGEWHKPASFNLTVRHFYDGLGREIQTHPAYSVTLSGYSSPQDIVVSRGFDALGRAVSETAPYAVPAYVWNPSAPTNPYTTTNLSTAPRTTTQYDGLSRPLVITGTDGTVTRHHYGSAVDNGRTLTYDDIIDPNQHRTKNRYDAFGRLARADEIDGNCGNYWGYTCAVPPYTTPWTDYSATNYSYDVLNNLTSVTDALTNTTVITYNVLGQKIGMKDPDMGVWSYGYDTRGNLITQTDAKGQTINFGYDALNRLTSKSTGVTYGYDAGTNGVGHRVAMTDTTGTTTWAYDKRGRVLTGTKVINGAGTFATSYGYDALDRVVTMTYPSGEVVTQTYNSASQLLGVRSVSNGVSYASGMTYNAPGQLTQMTYGNSVATNYTYDSLSLRLKRIQAGTLLDLSYRYDAVPIQRYAKLVPDLVPARLADLQALIAGSSKSGAEWPLLPVFSSKQMFVSQTTVISFQNGKGIRYLTQYTQGIVPINNQEIFYSFQGLTADGQYWVSAILPIRSPLLLADGKNPPGGQSMEAFAQNYKTYIADTTARINAEAPGNFTPGLAMLDGLINSIIIQP